MGKQPDRFEERRQLIARVIQQRVNYRPDCPNYSQISPRNRIVFRSASHAEALGYRFSEKCP